MGGAAAAAVIAARQRRIQEIIDAFRLADATASDRARSLETIGLIHTGEFKDLLVDGVVMPGEREGTYYLSEVGYISRREDKRGLKAVLIVLVVMLALGALLIPLMARRG